MANYHHQQFCVLYQIPFQALEVKIFIMGKDKSEKRDKKEKKEKRSESDGVKKSSKKDKKVKLSEDNVAAAIAEVTKEPEVVEMDIVIEEKAGAEVEIKPVGALVPFANPLADEKVTKKVLKSVKKGKSFIPIISSFLPE